jgi:protein-arginine deiminase
VGGKDPFVTQLEQAMAKVGYTVDWIEDWDLYHRLSGEVHCGSNTKRAIVATKWWESVR